MDTIYLRNLQVSAIVGKDAWERDNKLQPLVLNIRVERDVKLAGKYDNIKETISYGQMCKDVMNLIDSRKSGFMNISSLSLNIQTLALDKGWAADVLHVTITSPKASLRAEGGLELRCIYVGEATAGMAFLVKDLKTACIIGVNAHERQRKQMVVIDLKIEVPLGVAEDALGGRDLMFDHYRGVFRIPGQIHKSVEDYVLGVVEASCYETLEALATEIAEQVVQNFVTRSVTVSIEKPSALVFVDGAGVEITRRAS